MSSAAILSTTLLALRLVASARSRLPRTPLTTISSIGVKGSALDDSTTCANAEPPHNTIDIAALTGIVLNVRLVNCLPLPERFNLMVLPPGVKFFFAADLRDCRGRSTIARADF